MVAVPVEFARGFAAWEAKLRGEGETSEGIAEIRQAVRDAWSNAELRELWIAFVRDIVGGMGRC